MSTCQQVVFMAQPSKQATSVSDLVVGKTEIGFGESKGHMQLGTRKIASALKGSKTEMEIGHLDIVLTQSYTEQETVDFVGNAKNVIF